MKMKAILTTISILGLPMTLMANTITDNSSINGRVLSSTANYKIQNESRPSEICSDVRVSQQQQSSGSNISAGTIIGGILGGVLGNQIGGGQGKTAATIGGAILGSQVGNSRIGNNNQSNSPVYQQQCRTEWTTTQTRVVDGYQTTVKLNNGKVLKFKTQYRYSVGYSTQIMVNKTYSLR